MAISAARETSVAEARSTPWHALPIDEVERLLGTSSAGLTQREAAVRLARYGPNQIEEEAPPSDLAILFNQVRSPLVITLIAAAAITTALGEAVDTLAIALVVIINTVIGFVQERQAERAVHALLQLVTPRARVVREHQDWEIDSREVVPGDLVLLESGSRVPADLRLVATTALQIDESTLTGESLPVVKRPDPLPEDTPLADRTNLAFAGTIVVSGRGRGYVVATGRNTELGAIAGQMRSVARVTTPLQERMARLARVVGAGVAACAALAFAVGIAAGRPVAEMFLIAVALAVSAVPEGLPIAFTITLAMGVRRMARRNAIVRHLPSVETLGSTTVIGSDKTGTLTENLMTVRQIWSAGMRIAAENPDRELLISQPARDALAHLDTADSLLLTLLTGILTNEATVSRTAGGFDIKGDPTEAALLIAAFRFGLEPDEIQEALPVFAEIPFEPERQYSASFRLWNGRLVSFVKGAPERVLAMSSTMLTAHGREPLDPALIQDTAHALASEGLRVLAMAYAILPPGSHDPEGLGEPRNLTFVGLQGLADPPRTGAREAIAQCRDAGIRVIMITGDHAATARAIARELGIAGSDAPVLTGVDLQGLDDEHLCEAVRHVDVYARVTPEHKLRIVKALQRHDEVVAVTGDGVNDAPALRAADIGVAMGKRGTDVAKEASDIVLADDNFVTIVSAVEEGRITFDNVRKAASYLFATNVAEVLTILVALALNWPLPLIAVQILWLNLVTDSAQVLALAVEPGEPDVMRRPPRGRGAGVLSRRLWERVVLSGVVMTIGTLVLYRWDLSATGSETHARTMALTTMVMFQMYQAANMRLETRSLLQIPPLSNPYLFAAIAASLAIHLSALYIGVTQTLLRVEPIDLMTWARIILVAATILITVEIHKRIRRADPELAPRRYAAAPEKRVGARG